jgi:hypothetical protein
MWKGRYDVVWFNQRNRRFPVLVAAVLAVITLAGTEVEARHTHPDGWKVSVSSQPVSKHGMYEIDVRVQDETGAPARDARVQVRLHSFKAPGYRLVEARRVEDGWYRTWNRLNTPQDQPRRLKAIVTRTTSDR